MAVGEQLEKQNQEYFFTKNYMIMIMLNQPVPYRKFGVIIERKINVTDG